MGRANPDLVDLVGRLIVGGPEDRPPLIAIVGAQGSGKTTLARAAAERFGAAQISIDDVYLTRAERERLRSGDSLSRSESTANRGLLGALAGSLDRSIDIDPEVKRKKRNKTIREVVLVSLGVIVVFSTSVFLAKWIDHRFIELRRTNAEASGQSLPATDPGTTSPPVEGSVSEGASAAPTSDASAASPTPP